MEYRTFLFAPILLLSYAVKMTEIAHVKGVIWDLDGTLLDSYEIFEQVVADLVKDTGHTMPTHEQMLNNYHGSLNETLGRVLGIESREEVEKTVDLFLARQEHHYADDLETHLFLDAVGLAQRAAEKRTHQLLVTNRSHKGRGYASPYAIIAGTTLASYIHEVRPGDEIEHRKPDRRSVDDWMDKHGLRPAEVIVVGDQFVDAQLALNIGARAVLVARNGSVPHLEKLSEPDHADIIVVDSLDNVTLV